MKIKGKIFSGMLRGEPLIGLYFHRLIGILGYEPFKGTMNVRLENKIDIEVYSTKAIDQILMDGTRKVDAFLAPIIFSAKDQDYECWAMMHTGHTYEANIIEIVARENLKEKFSLKDDDEVEITFTAEKKKKRGIPGLGILKKLYGRQTQLTR